LKEGNKKTPLELKMDTKKYTRSQEATNRLKGMYDYLIGK